MTLISSARTLGASEWRIFLANSAASGLARGAGRNGAGLCPCPGGVRRNPDGGRASIPGVTQTIPIAIFFAAESGRMGVALAWVLLMIAVSLVVIVGINYANRGKAHQAAAANELVKRGLPTGSFCQLRGESVQAFHRDQSRSGFSNPGFVCRRRGMRLVGGIGEGLTGGAIAMREKSLAPGY